MREVASGQLLASWVPREGDECCKRGSHVINSVRGNLKVAQGCAGMPHCTDGRAGYGQGAVSWAALQGKQRGWLYEDD